MGQRSSDHPVLPGLAEPGRRTAQDADRVRQTIAEKSNPKPILPQDLEQALTRLDNAELARLAAAVSNELHRRGLPASTAKSTSPVSALHSKIEDRQASEALSPAKLSQSRMNAVRAAIKAGVKPTLVARQFGVTLPTLRKILSDDQK